MYSGMKDGRPPPLAQGPGRPFRGHGVRLVYIYIYIYIYVYIYIMCIYIYIYTYTQASLGCLTKSTN